MSAVDADFQDLLREAGADQSPLMGHLILIAVLGLLVTAFIWASWTEIDEVTRGQGKVVPSRQLQVLQSMEGGVVRQINVRQGQSVREGEILMVLDVGVLAGGYLELRQQYFGLLARIERLSAEIEGRDLTFAAATMNEAAAVAAAEQQLFLGRRAQLNSDVRVLEQALEQRREEWEESKIALATALEGISLLAAELAIIEPLVAQGVEPELSRLQLQRSLSELRGQRDRSQRALRRGEAAIAESQARLESLRDGFRAQALAELSETHRRVAELEQGMPSRADQVARAEIRSPVDGIVNRVHMTTIGGVARSGDPLLEVVPADEALRVEAYIRPADIAFLRPGQPVKVKLTAYDFARYGGLDGVLEVIGADAVELPEHPERMYPIQVQTEGYLYDVDGHPLDIIPGMVAEVDILSGKRTVLDYLVEPVVKVRDRAFRD